MERVWKKADTVLLVCLLLFLAGAQGLVRRSYGSQADARTVLVTVDDEEYGRYSLSDGRKRTYTIETAYGINVLTVEEGRVFVETADCGDKTCVHMGAISQPGQLLVCAPHHLIITIEGEGAGSEPPVDAITR